MLVATNCGFLLLRFTPRSSYHSLARKAPRRSRVMGRRDMIGAKHHRVWAASAPALLRPRLFPSTRQLDTASDPRHRAPIPSLHPVGIKAAATSETPLSVASRL